MKDDTQRLRSNSHSMSRITLTMLLLSLSSTLMLGACATTSMTGIHGKIACEPWRAITYSSKSDTAPTVKQIKIHNQTGRNLRCWP